MLLRLIPYSSALVLAAVLAVAAPAQQENPGELQREQQADRIAKDNSAKEPHMGAALQHLRQAEEEIEKANAQHGGHREKAMNLTKQAENEVIEGMRYYNENVLHMKK